MDDPRRTDPPRLTSGAADLGRRERAAGALLRHVVRGNPVSLREIARVRDRLRGRESARTPARRRASAAAIVILVLGTIGLGAGAASRLGAVQSWARRHLGAAVPRPTTSPAACTASIGRRRRWRRLPRPMRPAFRPPWQRRPSRSGRRKRAPG